MTSSPGSSQNVNNLGYFLDGWADLVEDIGGQVGDVREHVMDDLVRRDMPDIDLWYVDGVVGLTSEKRDYILSKTSPGATTTIYIDSYGADLYVSWRTFIRPVINWLVIIIMQVVAGALAIPIARSELANLAAGNFYLEFVLPVWIGAAIGLLTVEVLLVSIVARAIKGNRLAFFFVEPNLFDADDITVMGMAAHRAILRGLDLSGIDISELRPKQEFLGGRRGEKL